MSLRYTYRTDRLNTKGLTTINARIFHNSKTHDFSTGFRLKPTNLNLNSKNGTIKVKPEVQNATDINMKLNSVKLQMDDFLNTQPNCTDENIKEQFYRLIGKSDSLKATSQDKTIQELYDEMIEELSVNQDMVNSQETLKSKKSKMKKFLKMCKEVGVNKVSGLKESHFTYYRESLDQFDFEDSTLHKNLGEVKQFLRWLYSKDYGLNFNPENIKISNKLNQKPKDDSYLTDDEINLLINHIPSSSKLSYVKDIFLFQLLTGQRVSDVLGITWNEIISGKWTFVQQKTKKVITIKLEQKAINIINKYRRTPYPLPRKSPQKYNDYLKELFKEAGIDRLITRFEKKKGKTKQVPKPFYEVVSSHVARHTFVSMHLAHGVSSIYIANQTGQTLKTIETYAKTNNIITSKVLGDSFNKIFS